MTENFRALFWILCFSIPTLVYLRKSLTYAAIAPADYAIRAGLWVFLTAALFLAHSFWLFVLMAVLALITVGRRDSSPLGLYLFLLLVSPPFQSSIDGFAGINRFLDINYLRLLSLVILLPLTARLLAAADSPPLFKLTADKFLFLYLALQLILQVPTTSFTDLLRSVATTFIDVFLPYYAFSRGLLDARRRRDAFASFSGSCAVFAVLGLLEFNKSWLLYGSLPDFLGVTRGFGDYLLRDGTLRAIVTAGHSIAFGYVMTAALGLHLALRASYPNPRAWWTVALLLVAGLMASMSRGPWVGAAAMIALALFLAPGTRARLGKAALISLLVAPLIMLTPYGSKFVSLLPFVGDADQGSVDYRQQLFEVSWNVLMQYPFFGSPYYLADPAMQQMRQGEGLIDMVNSYLGVAMSSGFVGLALFAAVFAASAWGVFARLSLRIDTTGEDYAAGVALLSTLAGVLIVIATASSIYVVPIIYWSIAGACAAYAASFQGERGAQYFVPRKQQVARR